MGATSSSLSELSDNSYLQKLSGQEIVTELDPFWNQLLSFHIQPPLNSADSRLLEESVAQLCKNFAINNCKTGNLGSLVRVFLVRAGQLREDTECESEVLVWQTYNALFIIRTMVKYFIEHLSEEVILQEFETKPPDTTNAPAPVPATSEGSNCESLVEEFVNAIIELVVDLPVRDFTYALHLECVSSLLSTLAIQMFQPKPPDQSAFYRYIMAGKCSMHSCLLTKRLLQHYTQQFRAPPSLLAQPEAAGGSLLGSMASGLWNMLGGSKESAQKEGEESNDTYLANQSLLLLLVLVNYCATENNALHNPYREALSSFTNSQAETSESTTAGATFRVDLSELYETLGRTLVDDQTTLLLYLLIHRNPAFKAYVLSRANIDVLIVPLLEILYQAETRNSHHIYMALIVLLILSEDDCFAKAVHEIKVKTMPWFKERHIDSISLGGLTILVIIRTIQFNMRRMRDKYLHTNCLAALANMSSQFRDLHPHVAQKLVGLFGQLSKRHHKLVEAIREAAMSRDPETEQDMSADLGVLEEVLRMVLEIINSTLTSALHLNPNLTYALLYHKHILDPFRTHPAFQDIIQNLDMVIGFLNDRLEKHKDLAVEQVLQIVREGSLAFRRDKLKKFPELKFKYVEEEQPDEFFIPYVWSLVHHSSTLFFTPQRIQLFSLHT